MNKRLLNRALKKYKSQSSVARELGVSRQFIHQLVKGIRPIPNDIADKIRAILK